jgi:glycosyltransferase involved in cell wall biosynthesis
VITPCYNGARFLAQTLESALAQTRLPLEILVVDDGSTDDSARIAESFGAPVRVMRQPNQGESVARNTALSEARGSHVLFLDADDLLEPTSISRLTEVLTGRDNGVAIMGCALFAEDPALPYATRLPDTPTFYPAIIESNLAPPHCWLTPIEMVRQAGGFYAELRWFEDWDLWWRVGLLDPVLVPVLHLGALYRRHPGSQLATTKLADQARGHASLMARMAAAFLGKPDMLDQYGEQLFWGCVTALQRARGRGVPWVELAPLSSALREIAVRGPAAITSSRMGQSIRLVGVRLAANLHSLTAGGRSA